MSADSSVPSPPYIPAPPLRPLDTYGVEVESFGGAGKTWKLPPRQLGKFRHLGWFFFLPLLFTLPFVGGIFQFAKFAIFNAKNANAIGPMEIASLVFVSLFALPLGYGAWRVLKVLGIGWGLITQNTRCTIRFEEDEIITQERMSWFYWDRKLTDTKTVHSLAVVSSDDWANLKSKRKNEANVAKFPLPEHLKFNLLARVQGGDLVPIVIAYPADLLNTLVLDIGTAVGLKTESLLNHEAVSQALQSDAPENSATRDWTEAVAETVFVQPEDSTILVERREDGVTMTVPKQGLFKGSRGLFFFALLWTSFSTFIGTIFLLATFGVIPNEGKGSAIIGVLFIGVFEAVGIALIVAAIHMGTRSSTVATSYGMLFISTLSIFGKKTQQWERENIASIDFGPSGMEVNNQPVMQLQVIDKDGKKFGCLTQLSHAELEWVAYELRKSLEMSSSH